MKNPKLNLVKAQALVDRLLKEPWFIEWCKEMAKK